MGVSKGDDDDDSGDGDDDVTNARATALAFTKHLRGDIDGAIELYHQTLRRKPEDSVPECSIGPYRRLSPSRSRRKTRARRNPTPLQSQDLPLCPFDLPTTLHFE